MVHKNFKLADPALLISTGWINDEGVSAASGKTFDVVDPANGETWSKAPAMDEVDTDKAIAAAAEAFPTFSQISARQRARMILALDAEVRKHKEDLAQMLVMESGKALVEARAEVDYASESLWKRAVTELRRSAFFCLVVVVPGLGSQHIVLARYMRAFDSARWPPPREVGTKTSEASGHADTPSDLLVVHGRRG